MGCSLKRIFWVGFKWVGFSGMGSHVYSSFAPGLSTLLANHMQLHTQKTEKFTKRQETANSLITLKISPRFRRPGFELLALTCVRRAGHGTDVPAVCQCISYCEQVDRRRCRHVSALLLRLFHNMAQYFFDLCNMAICTRRNYMSL